MTITQLHLANFLQLVEEAGSLTKLARKCGYDNAASLSQLKRRLEEQAEDEKARGIRPSLAAKLKAGIRRYGHAYVPLDEALSRVVIDLSGRPGLVYNIDFTRALIGRFDVDLFEEFFHGVVNHSMMTLHIDNLSGHNAHHQAETVFKAFGRALRMAAEYDPRMAGQTPSTKGTLSDESVAVEVTVEEEAQSEA